jgi:hypothetical protein
MTFTESFQELVKNIQSNYTSYFVALAGLGVLTSAVVQVLKNLLPLRYAFHRWALARWLKRKNPARAAEIQPKILAIAANGNAFALYDAETDEFCRNLEAVGQIAIDHPGSYLEILQTLTSPLLANDIQTVTNAQADRQMRMDARDRLRQHLAQSLNAFRLSTTSKWTNSMHVSSFLISLGLASWALWLSSMSSAPLPLFGTALLAAFLAPVAHDIVSALGKLKSK